MSTSLLTSKNRTSLPADVVSAAGLNLNDEIAWHVTSEGVILGRKLVPLPTRGGKLVKDAATGLSYWSGNWSGEEMESAALEANPSRHD